VPGEGEALPGSPGSADLIPESKLLIKYLIGSCILSLVRISNDELVANSR